MDDYHPDHDIFVSVRGNIHSVCFSDFPVSDIYLQIRTWLISFRIAFVWINWFMADRKLSEQLYRAVKFFSVQPVMDIVAVPLRSNEAIEMENS